jgi:PAS domain S-box-containing protein
MKDKKILNSWSIRKKLLLLLLIIFLPAFGIIVINGLNQRQHEIEDAKNNALLVVQSLATQQEQIASATRTMLSVLAQLPVVQNLDARACNELFRQLHSRYSFYSTILAVRPDGNVFAASTPFEPGTNLSDRKHVKDAIRTLNFSVGEYIVGRVSNVRSLNFTYPVLDKRGKLVAVVIAGFNLNEYARFVSKANMPAGHSVVVADWRGIRLFRVPPRDSSPLGKAISEKAYKIVSGDREYGFFEGPSGEGVDRIYAFRQLRLREGSPPYLYVLVAMPKDKILHEAGIQMVRNLSILGIAAIVGLLVAWILGNFALIEPINRLVAAAQLFGKGEMGTRTGLSHGKDELGRLAESFDDMASLVEMRNAEREISEKRQALANKILETLNGHDKITNLLRRIPLLLKDHAGIEAVSIRLKTEEDFPYFAAQGFSEDFLEKEKTVCAHHEDGEIVRDDCGKPCLECLCGAVIRGRTDSSRPFFTRGGSFWTGHSAQFAAMAKQEQIVESIRGRCMSEGYESIALVPVRAGEEIVGLLQLNDKASGRFDASFVEFLEGVAASIGIALFRKEAEEMVQVSEQRYRTIFERAFEGIFQTTARGKLISVNPALARMYGFPSPEEMLAEVRNLASHPFVRPEDHLKCGRILEDQGYVERYETKMQQRNGNVIWVSFSARAVQDTSGKTAYLEGMVEDITDRKTAELSLRNALKELETEHKELETVLRELQESQNRIIQQEKMASIGQLAAGVAHEINNPTGFIISNLNTLRKYMERVPEFVSIQSEAIEALSRQNGESEGLSLSRVDESRRSLKIDYILEDSQVLIKECLEGADRVKLIVQDLKNFSRVDGAERSAADINKVLDSTLNVVWNELKYKAAVKKEYQEMPLVVCNAGQLGQVFMNILVNAAQAIPEFGEIRVRTWEENGSIHVTISDTGSGIPEGQLGRVFEPFFTTKEVGRGTGLGLSIAYDIVKKHQGEIEVMSSVGEGTTFAVKIPVNGL